MRENIIQLFTLCLLITTNLEAKKNTENKPYQPSRKDLMQPLSAEIPFAKKNNKLAIIGEDKRFRPGKTTRYPLRALGQLIMISSDNSEGTCSATLISPKHLLTAAHCVYDQDSQSFFKNIYFIPGRDGDIIPYGMYGATHAYIPKDYPSSTFRKNNADVAVLKLSTSLGDKLGYLGYKEFQEIPKTIMDKMIDHAIKLKDRSSNNKDYESKITKYLSTVHEDHPTIGMKNFGYSGDKNNEVWQDNCILLKENSISTEKYLQLESMCDMQGGASGSGLIDSEYNVIGVTSFHNGESIKTSSGKETDFFKGGVFTAQNIITGISPYTYALINQWKNGYFDSDTISHQFKVTNDLKQVTINNNCNENIWIAMRYVNLDGKWVNEGFWETRPYSSVVKSVTSYYYYYYATNKKSSVKWTGDDTYQKLYGTRYGFRKKSLTSEFKNEINLNCD